MRKTYYVDTESCGFYGPTILMQHSVNKGPINLYNVWDNSVYDTLSLIEDMVDSTLVGFNWVHDGFHFHRTYNVLKQLPALSKPDPFEYEIVEQTCDTKRFCINPYRVIDLMLIARRTKYQAVMNQKPITMRKVPTLIVDNLIAELDKIEIPDIYFSKSKKGYRWNVIPLHKGTSRQMAPVEQGTGEYEVDPNFVDLKLIFSPSTALKAIVESLGGEVIYHEELIKVHNPVEYEYYPQYQGWRDVLPEHIHAWKYDARRLQYAKADIEDLYIVENDLKEWLDLDSDGNYTDAEDVDSTLAFRAGGQHWKGFSIDETQIKSQLDKCNTVVNKVMSEVNFNSPKQVKSWLLAVANEGDRLLLDSTSKETLTEIIASYLPETNTLTEMCKAILQARALSREKLLYEALLSAGAFYAALKILGAKSNRMAGGSESYISTKGAINPHGVKKSNSVRAGFPLAWDSESLDEKMYLDGGDFDSFEVSIGEAEFKEPMLTEALASGKKTHAVFGAAMFSMTYEEVLATENENINSPTGYYQRAKRGFFAMFYGAMEDTLSESMWITKEEARAGLDRYLDQHPVIKQYRQDQAMQFTAVKSAGRGKYEWCEHSEYVESFFGFRRYFTVEYLIIKRLWELAVNPPESLTAGFDSQFVKRRDRQQTVKGATSSALFACLFGLQNQIIRASGNHVIQSPGANITKELQYRLSKLQPKGISFWHIMLLNVHDELLTPIIGKVRDEAKTIVTEFIAEYKKYVPFLSMGWKQGLLYWGYKKPKNK